MTEARPIDRAANADLRNSGIALRRAAQRAREIAAKTGTALVVVRNGVLEHVYPAGPEPIPAVAQDTSPPCGNRP